MTSTDWHLWCRLCAKDDVQGNINVFLKNEQQTTDGGGAPAGGGDLALATAIGRYFWVNISRGEELPEMICTECLTLVTSLVNFSERITRVQKLFSVLQSNKQDEEDLNLKELRIRFGLLEEEEQVELETLTEVHYVDEKPKIIQEEEEEMDTEFGFELENPLNEPEEEEDDEVEPEAEQQEEVILKLCEAFALNEEQEVEDEDVNISPKTKTNLRLQKRDKSHQCSECPRVYATASTLSRHMRMDHGQLEEPSPQFSCPECSKKFHSPWNLKRHAQQHQPLPKRKIYPCSSCDKMFTTSASATQHAQYMHQEERPRPVICEQCGVSVHSLGALKEHILKHTDDAPFECDVCKKCFKSSRRLKHHQETHDPHKYVCPECGMQLNSKPTLNRHRLVHTDQMQHKCDYCGREFKRAKALKNHLILHTGLKPYSCDFCDRTFANGSNCRTHKKKVHPEELAAQEAAGGAKTYNRNIPKLEALKAFTKNKDNLSPVATKQSGCFAFGKKPKPLVKTDVNVPHMVVVVPETSPPATSSNIPTIDNIYNHILKQSPPTTKSETNQPTSYVLQPQQQLVILSDSDGSATLATTTSSSGQAIQDEQMESSAGSTQVFSY